MKGISPTSDGYNHTKCNEQAWWKLTFPRNVYVTRIVITNRPNQLDRLKKFTVTVTGGGAANSYSKSKNLTAGLTSYTFSSINTIGKIITIKLDENQCLHMMNVQVFGKIMPKNTTFKGAYKDITSYGTATQDTSHTNYPATLAVNSKLKDWSHT